jgi:hypothetical protein
MTMRTSSIDRPEYEESYMEKNNTLLPKDHQLANRYALATVDMEEVIRYLDCYDQLNKLRRDADDLWDKTCHGLLSAAIVAYCRPFSSNYSRGYAAAKLPVEALAMLTFRKWPELRELHNLLIEKRNTVIAHADWEARNVEITVTAPVSLHVTFSKPDIWQGVDMQAFRKLADEVRQDCVFATLPHARRGVTPTNDV